jgi:arylsulfatase A-like enzyme/GH43 family beta-xylosidase
MKSLPVLLALLSCLGGNPLVGSPSDRKPNIVLILADDMGFSDIGCYGSEIPTPHLDALANGGLRFTQFYNTARCSPTRAALLTGLHPHQAGMGRLAKIANKTEQPAGYLGYLNDHCVTVAEVLRSAGYRTYMAGKWHLGSSNQEWWPLQRGFDRFYGHVSGGGSYFQPRGLTRDNTPLPVPTDPDYYTTDAFTDFAIETVREHRGDHPFFLYLAYTAPHWPLHARTADIAKFVGQYRAGWDRLRAARHAKQIASGIVTPDWPLSERDAEARAWEALTEQQKTDLDYRMAVYAAQVHRIDWNIGRLVAALRERGQLDNTLLLFLSDNGGCAEPYTDLGGQAQANINDPKIGTNVSYGTGWANLSNTPFRKFKSMLHEGGIATPLVVHWPAGLQTKPGAIDATPGYLTDIMATAVAVSGATYPQKVGSRKIAPLEGVSLVPRFAAAPASAAPRTFYWEQYGYKAVRTGDLKAIYAPKDSYDSSGLGRWELYDVARDRTELHDIAAARPDDLKRLVAQWDTWAARVQVYPVPGFDINGGPGTATKKKARSATAAVAPVAPVPPARPAGIATADLRIRDPFVYADSATQTYYLYRQMANGRLDGTKGGPRGVEVFQSKDLKTWTGPTTVFSVPTDFWADADVWAPEMHAYRGKFYLFVTFTDVKAQPGSSAKKAGQPRRGTQVLVSDSPAGPFRTFANQAHTPADWMCLDGTLWIEDGVPWMVFCHEWLQIVDGSMELVQLTPDLSAPVGTPQRLFKASEAPWAQNLRQHGFNRDGYVTDGPFIHRTKSGKLLMIWSSYGSERYAVGIAESTSGKIAGPWVQQPERLIKADGGHGMIFRTFEGQLMMSIHQPNESPLERLRLIPLVDTGDSLQVASDAP